MSDARYELPTADAVRLVLVTLLALAVYAVLFPAVTGDMRIYLIPWLNTILERGQIGAFNSPFSNYTPAYLYLLALFSPLAVVLSKASVIKAVSIAGTFLLAMAARKLVKAAGSSGADEAMLWLLVLPSIALNGVGFGQCDALWSAGCVMAVLSAIQRRPVAMLVWFGIGLSFKAQAMFLAPFILQRLVQERTPLQFWVLPALIFALAMLPASLAGWPLSDLATVYFRQAAWNPEFIGNAANPWSLVQYLSPTQGPSWLWLGFIAAATAAAGYVLVYRQRGNNTAEIIALALFSALLMPFLLPKMHERFFFLADVLAFVLAFVRRDQRSWLIFALVQLASVMALAGLMFGVPLAPVIGAAMNLSAILLLIGALRTGSQLCDLPNTKGTADFDPCLQGPFA